MGSQFERRGNVITFPEQELITKKKEVQEKAKKALMRQLIDLGEEEITINIRLATWNEAYEKFTPDIFFTPERQGKLREVDETDATVDWLIKTGRASLTRLEKSGESPDKTRDDLKALFAKLKSLWQENNPQQDERWLESWERRVQELVQDFYQSAVLATALRQKNLGEKALESVAAQLERLTEKYASMSGECSDLRKEIVDHILENNGVTDEEWSDFISRMDRDE